VLPAHTSRSSENQTDAGGVSFRPDGTTAPRPNGDCEQEIEAVESVQQEPVIALKSKSPEAGLGRLGKLPIAYWSAAATTRAGANTQAKTEFEQGHIHGRNDATGWHPIYSGFQMGDLQ
jgi:hypothetical protein